MESKYYVQQQSGVVQNIYENETYNLTIGTNGSVNLDKKTSDSNVIINQLIEDLSRTTIKLQNIMRTIEFASKQGFLPTEYVEQLSEYIYEMENKNSLKK